MEVWQFVIVCVLSVAQVTLAVWFAVVAYQWRKATERQYKRMR